MNGTDVIQVPSEVGIRLGVKKASLEFTYKAGTCREGAFNACPTRAMTLMAGGPPDPC